MKLISLIEWDKLSFEKPHCLNTLRKWARSGMIQPQPKKVGREYLVIPTARYTPEAQDADDVVMEVVYGKTA